MITPGWPPLKFPEILPDETRRSCLKFLFNALRFYRDHGVKVFRVMTHPTMASASVRAAPRRSTPLHKGVRMLKIKPKRTTPYTPRTNGKAERFVPTSLREWAYAKPSNH